jgi:hypothetical protein
MSDQLNALSLFIQTYILLEYVSAYLRHLQVTHQFEVTCLMARYNSEGALLTLQRRSVSVLYKDSVRTAL